MINEPVMQYRNLPLSDGWHTAPVLAWQKATQPDVVSQSEPLGGDSAAGQAITGPT